MASTLFQTSKKVVKKAGEQKKDTKLEVLVPELKDAIQEYNEAKEAEALAKVNVSQAKAKIAKVGTPTFLDLYKKDRKNPDSFILKADDDHKVMYIPKDSYAQIDEERKEVLENKYPKIDLIEEKNVFTLDPEMVVKYEKELSDLIMNSKKIDPADKGRLIINNTTYSIKKGTIDKLTEVKDDDMKELLADIRPTFDVKRIGGTTKED